MSEHLVPRSILNASREEISEPENLTILEGELPDDLHGHMFIVAPVGNFELDENRQPILRNIYREINKRNQTNTSGNTFMNGDGMIYRLDFDEVGQVKWMQKIANPPDYEVDKGIQEDEDLEYGDLLKFDNFGLTRFSPLLGLRNELNTAFLPIKFGASESERLLVTYDAGFPYEINTQTLEVTDPVGSLEQWTPAFEQQKQPFPMIFSTAHPVFDGEQRKVFIVSYSRSLFDLLTSIDILKIFQSVFKFSIKPRKKDKKDQWFICHFFSWLKKTIQSIEVILRLSLQLLSCFNIFRNDSVSLMKWDGSELNTWKLVDSNNKPIKIRQSIHQMGVTENYIVIMDTSFAVGIEQMINNWLFDRALPTWLRKLLRITPSPDNVVYIVPREQLDDSESAEAYQVTIPREIAHFLVDYSNGDDDSKITLHASHLCAVDISQWLRKGDKLATDSGDVPNDLLGMHPGPMDISLMGRYVIDVSELESKEPRIISTILNWHKSFTWAPGLYAYRDILSPGRTPPEKLEKIYWTTLGLWKELMTKFMYDQYKKYPYRTIPLDEILELAEEGIPSCLYRLDATSANIEDYYEFPRGHMAFSPQFIPRQNGTDSPTDG
ncbi:MAG: carotenoid oxygenase family protein [Moorea sp. SIO2B7]|nr:carotenoid oxygenase family protein [Moorena sp. SIO2B7]